MARGSIDRSKDEDQRQQNTGIELSFIGKSCSGIWGVTANTLNLKARTVVCEGKCLYFCFRRAKVFMQSSGEKSSGDLKTVQIT